MKYAWITRQNAWPTEWLCGALGVSASGYAARERGEGQRRASGQGANSQDCADARHPRQTQTARQSHDRLHSFPVAPNVPNRQWHTAWFRGRPATGLIHRPDRGSQYASHDYQAVLEEDGMTASMSRTRNGRESAPTESFSDSLKNGRTPHQRHATGEEARPDSFEYIEVFYNRSRRRSASGYQSPAAFYATWPNQQKLAA